MNPRRFIDAPLTLFILGTLTWSQVGAAETDVADAMHLLRDRCARCHSPEKRKGGLLMTSRENLLKGGETGAAIVPGKPDESLLIELLAADGDPHMPPKKQLPVEEASVLKNWIAAGAEWNVAAFEAPPVSGPVAFGTFPESYQPVTALATAPDGGQIAVARANRIDVFKLAEGKPERVKSFVAHDDVVQALAWSPGGKTLVSGGFRKLRVWDTTSWTEVKTLTEELAGRLTALAFAPDGKRLVAADSVPAASGHLRVFETGTWTQEHLVKAHSDAIYSIAFRPDGKQLASVSADKLACLWNPEDWTKSATLEGHTGFVLAAAYSPDSTRLATAGDDESIKVWELETLKQISHFTDRRPTGPVTDLIWLDDPGKKPDPKKEKPVDWIVAVATDGVPRLYTDIVVHEGAQRSTGAKQKAWTAGEAVLTAVVYSPNAKWVVAGAENGDVAAWDVNGKRVQVLK